MSAVGETRVRSCRLNLAMDRMPPSISMADVAELASHIDLPAAYKYSRTPEFGLGPPVTTHSEDDACISRPVSRYALSVSPSTEHYDESGFTIEDFLNRSRSWTERRKLNIQRATAATTTAELAECTFVPSITNTARKVASQQGSIMRRFDRDAARRDELRRRNEALRRKKLEAELQECTFEPNTVVSQNSYDAVKAMDVEPLGDMLLKPKTPEVQRAFVPSVSPLDPTMMRAAQYASVPVFERLFYVNSTGSGSNGIPSRMTGGSQRVVSDYVLDHDSMFEGFLQRQRAHAIHRQASIEELEKRYSPA